MKRVTGGVPGLLAAAVKDDVVTIKLQRQPTMADIPAYKSWYIALYDGYLALRRPFGMVFDLRDTAEMPSIDVAWRKVELTVALEGRTHFQVTGTAVLLPVPTTDAARMVIAFLNKMLHQRETPAPHKLTTSSEEAAAFVKRHHHRRAIVPDDTKRRAVKVSREKVRLL